MRVELAHACSSARGYGSRRLRRARPAAARRHARVGPRRGDGRARRARDALGTSPKATASRPAPCCSSSTRAAKKRASPKREAQLARAKRGSRSSRTVHASRRSTRARANLARARAAQTDAETEYTRVAELRKRELVAASAVDQALAARNQRRAETQAAEAQLRELTHGTRPEQVEQAAAAVAAARAALDTLELTRERLTVRAPRAGRVDALPFRPGDQPPLGAELVEPARRRRAVCARLRARAAARGAQDRRSLRSARRRRRDALSRPRCAASAASRASRRTTRSPATMRADSSIAPSSLLDGRRGAAGRL